MYLSKVYKYIVIASIYMTKVITLIGTRPEIIKMSPVLTKLDKHFDHILVFSGQHYSKDLVDTFFDELELRKPDFNLEVGSLSPARQIANIMLKFEEIIINEKPNAIVVHGDTNTTLAGAIVAGKYPYIKLIHVEAGCRSFNRKNTEEMNRIIVDNFSDLLFCIDKTDFQNLELEKVISKKIISGNTVFDSINRILTIKKSDLSLVLSEFNLEFNKYCIATFHRQETVDYPNKLNEIVNGLNLISKKIKVIILMHPRTKKEMIKNKFELRKEIIVSEPLSYSKTIGLLKNCKFCLTDSGGITQEAAFFKKPTVLFRNECEQKHFVKAGLNIVGCTTAKKIESASNKILYNLIKIDEIKLNITTGSDDIIIRNIIDFLK
jgi:UDP-N-acetylglucosamine 2-epimerase